MSAWTQLGKHLGMFTDKIEQNNTTPPLIVKFEPDPEEVKRIMERLENEY